MKTPNFADKLQISLDNTNEPSDILFFTGAGISAPDPCGFPLGKELHYLILLYCTDMARWEVEEFTRKNLILFEETVEIIIETYGKINFNNKIFDLINNLFVYEPLSEWKEINNYHKFFRRHIEKGGKHFTVNLDQFIELDIISLDSGVKEIITITANTVNNKNGSFNKNNFTKACYLFKIHGDPNEDELGIQGFLQRPIEYGFSPEVKDFFDTQLNEVKVVIFVGYGGVDIFDITPYFESKPNGFFKKTTALWIDYSSQNEDLSEVKELRPEQCLILSKFKDAVCIKGRPDVLLNQLFDNSTIPEIEIEHNRKGYRKEYENFFKINVSDFFAALGDAGKKIEYYAKVRTTFEKLTSEREQNK